jgi:hypothetical protein
MPDIVLMAESLLTAAVVAAVVLLAIGLPTNHPPWRVAAGWIAALAVGIYAGCYLAGEWPRFPPTEDRHRFLLILLPLALAVEAAAMLLPGRGKIAWSLRLAVAALAAPILLYRSSYLTDLDGDGPGTAQWNLGEATVVLGLSAIMLVGVWMLLAKLQARTSPRALSPVLVLTLLACGLSNMLCGYYRGGLFALPLAGAMLGVAIAALVLPKQSGENPILGIGIVSIFTIRFIGRFYGSLPTELSLSLLFAPLLAWTGELPWFRKLPAGARAGIGIAAVVAALATIVGFAMARFRAASQMGY